MSIAGSKWNPKAFSTGNAEWYTPDDVRAAIDKEFGTTVDPNPVVREGLRERDGLSSWSGRVFCNPPYGHVLSKWIAHGLAETRNGHCELVVFLIPARTDTKWFHDIVVPNAQEIRFIRGRIRFINGKDGSLGSAPFPSMLVVFARDPPADGESAAARRER